MCILAREGNSGLKSTCTISMQSCHPLPINVQQFMRFAFSGLFCHAFIICSQPSLVIGAPFYRPASDNEAGGAVYVYYNSGAGVGGDESRVLLTPGVCGLPTKDDCVNAQFGHSVTNLGDINGDGFSGELRASGFWGLPNSR